MPAGCACEEEACEYSRIRDSFQIECLAELPPSHQPKPPDPLLCDLINGKRLPQCPPCPAEPWVVLAKVRLPASPTTSVTDIDNIKYRRQIYSTALQQEQLIACCCKTSSVADLVIEKTATVTENQEAIMYTIVVRNIGPSEAQNVIVKDTPSFNDRPAFEMRIPGTFTPIGTWVNSDATDQPFIAKIGTLAKDGEVTLGFHIKVGPNGTYINSVIVASDTSDPNMANNSASTETRIPRIE
jgi:uncharacterized repeat protein (TIGR01451 family)